VIFVLNVIKWASEKSYFDTVCIVGEFKRCMLALPKLSADFSMGCVHPAMQPPIPATHPTHAQRKRAGALAMGHRPEVDHLPR
jgi:hypothetical protein